MAIRVFDYTPGYPISYGSGSTEKQNSAWNKVVLEFERIYRLINDGFNYFERNIQEIRDIISCGGTGTVTDEMVCPVGSIIAYSGLLGSIPSNWHICDGTDGTPDLRDRFLMGTANAGDLDTYKSAGLPNITGKLPLATHTGRLTTWGYVTGPFYVEKRWEDLVREHFGDTADFHESDRWSDVEGGGFDASRSNPVYGNSDTVMPNSYVVYYIMRMS